MLQRFALAAVTCVLATACSGSAKEPEEPHTDTQPDGVAEPKDEAPLTEEEKRARALAELHGYQEAACERVAPRITECAIESAQANMTKEELAELDLENTAPKHTEKFIDDCTAGQMSLRQIKVFDGCDLAQPCEAFLACLAAADKHE